MTILIPAAPAGEPSGGDWFLAAGDGFGMEILLRVPLAGPNMSTDWPHDPDGDEGSEGMRKYGMAVIAKKVSPAEDHFPLDVAAFVDAHGDEPVRINYDSVVSVADVFEYVDEDSFDDIVSFHKAVGAAMREGGFWDYHPVGAAPEKKRA